METSKGLSRVATFAGAVLVGCGAAIAIASATAASVAAPTLRTGAVAPVAVEVVRLEPVVVTVSKSYYDGVRAEATALACSDAKKVVRG